MSETPPEQPPSTMDDDDDTVTVWSYKSKYSETKPEDKSFVCVTNEGTILDKKKNSSGKIDPSFTGIIEDIWKGEDVIEEATLSGKSITQESVIQVLKNGEEKNMDQSTKSEAATDSDGSYQKSFGTESSGELIEVPKETNVEVNKVPSGSETSNAVFEESPEPAVAGSFAKSVATSVKSGMTSVVTNNDCAIVSSEISAVNDHVMRGSGTSSLKSEAVSVMKNNNREIAGSAASSLKNEVASVMTNKDRGTAASVTSTIKENTASVTSRINSEAASVMTSNDRAIVGSAASTIKSEATSVTTYPDDLTSDSVASKDKSEVVSVMTHNNRASSESGSSSSTDDYTLIESEPPIVQVDDNPILSKGSLRKLQKVDVPNNKLVQVVAPLSLAEGYAFEVQSKDKVFIVEVPEGGVDEGDSFYVPLPDASYGQRLPSGAPIGEWKDGLFDFCRLGWVHPVVISSICCTQILMAQVMTRMQLNWLGIKTSIHETGNTFRTVLIVIGSYYILYFTYAIMFPGWDYYDENTGENYHVENAAGRLVRSIIKILFAAWSVYALGNVRFAMKEKYNIPTKHFGRWEDYIYACFCSCCITSQMARHSADYEQYDPVCCSGDGLPEDARIDPVCMMNENADSEHLMKDVEIV